MPDMYNSTNPKSLFTLYEELLKEADLPNATLYLNKSHEHIVKYLRAVLSWNLQMESEYQTAVEVLLTYTPPLLFIFGIVGNFLAFIVLVKFVGQFSTYHYFYTLAIMDTMVLMTGLLNIWIKELTDVSLDEQSGVLCKLFSFIGYFSSDVSVWLLIAITVERLLLLRFPLSTSTICTPRRTKNIILAILVSSAFINSHLFITVELQVTNSTIGSYFTMCAPVFQYERLLNDVWPWVDAVVYSFAPFIVIAAVNILSVQSVIDSCKIKSAIPKQQVKKLKKKYQKLTIMIFVLSFSFLSLTLPMNVMIIFTAFWNTADKPSVLNSPVSLVRTVVELLMYTKHSINFALYFWPGSQFRQQFYQTFCGMQQRRSTLLRRSQNNHTLMDSITSKSVESKY